MLDFMGILLVLCIFDFTMHGENKNIKKQEFYYRSKVPYPKFQIPTSSENENFD